MLQSVILPSVVVIYMSGVWEGLVDPTIYIQTVTKVYGRIPLSPFPFLFLSGLFLNYEVYLSNSVRQHFDRFITVFTMVKIPLLLILLNFFFLVTVTIILNVLFNSSLYPLKNLSIKRHRVNFIHVKWLMFPSSNLINRWSFVYPERH